MIIRWSPAPGTVLVAVFKKSQAVGTCHATVDTFCHGDLVRGEEAPLHKLARALTNPSGRYRLTQEHVATALVQSGNANLLDLVVDTLWPPQAPALCGSPPTTQPTVKALENVLEFETKGARHVSL